MREWLLGGAADEFLDNKSSMAILMSQCLISLRMIYSVPGAEYEVSVALLHLVMA